MSTRSPTARISAALDRARSRLRIRAGLNTSGWMIAAVSALALMVILLAAALGGASWLRISAQVTALALPTGLLLRLFIVPWWRSRSDAAVAAVLEQAAPSLGDGLLASVELQDHPDRAADPTLIPALFHQVAARLEVVDVRGGDLGIRGVHGYRPRSATAAAKASPRAA